MSVQQSAQDIVKEAGFLSLGRSVYLSRPKTVAHADTESVSVTKSPTVILLFGWMGARLPHLFKYTKVYDKLYPEATKILVRSSPVFFWSTQRAKEAALQPAIEVLEALGCIPPAKPSIQLTSFGSPIEPVFPVPQPRILAHAFSNGGCWQLVTLSDLIASRLPSRPSSPSFFSSFTPSLVILDSAPGSGGVRATQAAFSSAICSPVIRFLARLLIRLLYIYMGLKKRLWGGKTMIDVMTERMAGGLWVDREARRRGRVDSGRSVNKKALEREEKEGTTMTVHHHRGAKRLYLYSTSDVIIPSKEVEKHALRAQENGLDVTRVKFEGSGHVEHARKEPERYWSAVRDAWEEPAAGE